MITTDLKEPCAPRHQEPLSCELPKNPILSYNRNPYWAC
jgi:hypothetical protein